MALWLAMVGMAAPDPRVVVLRVQVEVAAAEVSAARQRGARRGVVANLMRRYRAAAEALAELEPRGAPTTVADDVARLAEAVASGKGGAVSRDAVVAALGQPQARIDVLQTVLGSARSTSDSVLRASLLLDLEEQARSLALVCAWDGWQAEQDRRSVQLRRTALAPSLGSQLGGVDGAALAARLDEQLAAHTRRRDVAQALLRRFEDLARRAVTAQETP